MLGFGLDSLRSLLLYIGAGFFATAIGIILFSFKRNKNSSFPGIPLKKGIREYNFVLETYGKTLRFRNPFVNFLAFGGSGSGKTKSIGKPLLREYIRHGFAGFIYDYKDFDLTMSAWGLVQKYKDSFPCSFYTISFTDLSRSHRFNPIKPSIVGNETLFLQLMNDFIDNYALGDKNEWYSGAKGIFKGVALRIYRDYPQFCTIPHLLSFICLKTREQITEFLKQDSDAFKQASAFLSSADSERTQASYFSTLTNYLADLSIEKNIAYVLSGDDFEFNLIDPEDPKLVCVANSNQVEGIISPVVGLLVTLSARRFTLRNQIPFFYLFDEATTFKIADFEKMPSVLREYKCSFTMLTQSPSKIEKLYGKHDRSSLEANFSNQFYGRTKDRMALEGFTYMFGKEDRKKISRSKGESRGGNSYGTTISDRLEERYDVNFFRDLAAGEFIGTATDSNVKDFHLRFKIYREKDPFIEDYIIRPVTDYDIERNYLRIIGDVQNLQ